MKKTSILILFSLLTLSLGAQTGNDLDSKKWGLEFNVIWPFVPSVEIYTAKATTTIWESANMHGDLTMGLLIRPGTRNDENAELFREFGFNIGYRHYFWKGYHAELAIYPSYALERANKIDGLDYQGFALTTEFYTGYKFNFLKDKPVSPYLIPQVGLGFNPISNLGPSSEQNGLFPALNLQVGINF